MLSQIGMMELPPGLFECSLPQTHSEPESSTRSRERRRVAMACREIASTMTTKYDNMFYQLDAKLDKTLAVQEKILHILSSPSPAPFENCPSAILSWGYWRPQSTTVDEESRDESKEVLVEDDSETVVMLNAKVEALTAVINELVVEASKHQVEPCDEPGQETSPAKVSKKLFDENSEGKKQGALFQIAHGHPQGFAASCSKSFTLSTHHLEQLDFARGVRRVKTAQMTVKLKSCRSQLQKRLPHGQSKCWQ